MSDRPRVTTKRGSALDPLVQVVLILASLLAGVCALDATEWLMTYCALLLSAAVGGMLWVGWCMAMVGDYDALRSETRTETQAEPVYEDADDRLDGDD
jgi:hypothetical protein